MLLCEIEVGIFNNHAVKNIVLFLKRCSLLEISKNINSPWFEFLLHNHIPRTPSRRILLIADAHDGHILRHRAGAPCTWFLWTRSARQEPPDTRLCRIGRRGLWPTRLKSLLSVKVLRTINEVLWRSTHTGEKRPVHQRHGTFNASRLTEILKVALSLDI